MKQLHYINGIEVNEPNNYQNLEVERYYNDDSEKNSITLNTWEFGGIGKKTLQEIIASGNIGGTGVIEGVRYAIVLDNEMGARYNLFDGYLNLWKSQVFCDKIVAPSIEYAQYDWLTGVYDSFTYAYLFDKGIITPQMFIPIPYVINKKQNTFESLTLLLGTGLMVLQLTKQIVTIVGMFADGANPFTTINAILKLSLEVVFAITLLVAIIKNLIDIARLAIQPVKYHMGMYCFDLLELGLAQFGITLSSTILGAGGEYHNAFILPEKYNLKEHGDGLSGWLDANKNEHLGFYKGTVGDFLRKMQTMFNAKVIIKDSVLYFEKQDFSLTSGGYVLPPLDNYEVGYEFNHEDFKSTMIFEFSTDIQDRNTIQEYKGTSVQITTLPTNINDKKLALAKDLLQSNFYFALGKRKTELTNQEKILKVFYDSLIPIVTAFEVAINGVITAINAVVKLVKKLIKALKTLGITIKFEPKEIKKFDVENIKNPIEERIGMLKMESDFISVPKILMIQRTEDNGDFLVNLFTARENKLANDNESKLNAKYLFNNYHYFKSFIGRNGYLGNQYLIKKADKVPFCFDDDLMINGNNYIAESNGDIGKLISVKFNPYFEQASISYKVNKLYLQNLTETITEPDGR